MTRKKLVVSKVTLKHLIDDDTDEEDNNSVDWSSDSEGEKNKEKSDVEEEEELDNIVTTDLEISEPEVNIEIVDSNNEKAVKITIDMEINDGSDDVVSIDFTISKETFLKIAKQLK